MQARTAKIRDLIGWMAAGLLLLALVGCGRQEPATGGGKRLPDTFTFFEVDANSTDGEALRRTLGGHLGAAAVAGRDALDLAVFPRIALDSALPALGALNRELNPNPRIRTEHAITSLTYRYPRERYPTFNVVRLVFSALHRHPLMITIEANSEAGAILSTLTAKYGPPRVIRPAGEDTTLWSWERDGDHLVVQKHLNKFDRPDYLIAIFYVARIRELLRAEGEKARTAGDVARERQAF